MVELRAIIVDQKQPGDVLYRDSKNDTCILSK